ncbi:MAG TPA: alpha-hydroxy acid oxidase [Candidatus Limnocylindrales bacterium]|nr:alpha-hydroxy acid oxidase [Candidatus Limnocylindrales bacterium]
MTAGPDADDRAVAPSRAALATTEELAAAVTLPDFRQLARRAVDAFAWDYIDGGSWDELSLAENEAAWMRSRFRPRVLVDVSRVDPSTTLLGREAAMPVAIAPMAAHGLAHADAEVATARAAAAAGVPFIPSTMSSRSMEEIAAAAPDATRFFQLYAQADPGRTRSLVERAEAAGYGAIVLTVDLPQLGYRDRDRRNGFGLDVPLGNFDSDGPGPTHAGHGDSTGYELLDESLATNLTWDSLATIRSWSGLPLIVKGILTGEDARLAAEHGVDVIVVSNHGGRQLDRTPAPIDVLEEVVAAAPDTEIWVDGGVRRGLDVAIACALGARGVLVGRPILWALAAGGQPGVERALAILREEFELGLTLLGAPTPGHLTRDHIV